MDSTTFAALVAVAADYFYMALKATEDFDSFLRAVRSGMREAAVAAVAECVERFDREVASQMPRSWEHRGKPSRTVVAMFGKVTYARSLYRDEHGRNRYPTDEILGIPKRRRLTSDVFLWLVARAARVSFRRTARDFLEVSGVKVSAMCAWRAVQQEGPLIVADLESSPSRGISQADVFAECDGIYIALQSPERRDEAISRFLADQARAKSSIELKAGASTPASARRASGAFGATSRCSRPSARPRRCAPACAPPSPPTTTRPTSSGSTTHPMAAAGASTAGSAASAGRSSRGSTSTT